MGHQKDQILVMHQRGEELFAIFSYFFKSIKFLSPETLNENE